MLSTPLRGGDPISTRARLRPTGYTTNMVIAVPYFLFVLTLAKTPPL
jgi:hypothetical protein